MATNADQIKTKTSWQLRAAELADVALTRFAIKTDRYGQYDPRGGASWSRGELTDKVLKDHFSGKQTIGLGSISPDDFCRWVAVDIDNHVSDVATNQNLIYAIVLRDRLSELGITCLIEDSDGKGGIHLWVLFESPVSSSLAHRFIHWLVRDYREHGLEKIEAFPKSPSVQHTSAKCGHYLRLPGRHHKRDHWSRFYGASDWMPLEQSVRAYLDITGNSPTLIPHIPEEPPKEVPPAAFTYIPLPDSGRDEALASDALRCITPDCGYDDWLKIGQALHSAGDHLLELWIEWSAGSKDFNPAECQSKWRTFNRGSGGVGLGTLFHVATENGWLRPQRKFVREGDAAGLHAAADGQDAKTMNETLPANAIELTLDEKLVNDAVIALLATSDDLYDSNGQLATIVVRVDDLGEHRVEVHVLSLSGLREIISQRVQFFIWKENKDTGDEGPAWQRIPRWTYEAILSRGAWPGIRPLRGIVTSPVLRADGSILQTAGYDAASGLFVDLSAEFTSVVDNPSTEDVQRAVATLFDLVCDFPFSDHASRSAWLGSLLTPLAREAYRGCTGPLFLFDANTRGTGKSLLADINALVVTGREATRLTSPKDDEECRKRVTALVTNSDRIVLVDNIAGRFGCASLDAALTGTVWKDRRLGHTELIEAPLRMTWYGSGNNVLLAADTARRVCHIRLESPLENPEDRSGFQHADIRKHVRQNRPSLLAAALTVLRGYIVAGRPDQKLKPWGSFEGWSDLVRQSIVWSGQADPGETRTELRETSDSEAGSLRQMLVAVAQVDQDQHGLRTSDMLKIATARDQGYAADDAEVMREAIEMFCGRSIIKANAQHLGNQLSHFRNRVVDQMAFNCTVKRGSNYWFVQSSGGPGGPGGPLSANLSVCFSSEDTSSEVTHMDHPHNTHTGTGENRSTRSTTSTTGDLSSPPLNPNLDWLEGSHL